MRRRSWVLELFGSKGGSSRGSERKGEGKGTPQPDGAEDRVLYAPVIRRPATPAPPVRRLRRENRRISRCTTSTLAGSTTVGVDSAVEYKPVELVAPRLSTDFDARLRGATIATALGAGTGRAKMTAKAYALTGTGV